MKSLKTRPEPATDARYRFAPATVADFDRLFDLRARVMREHVERLAPWSAAHQRRRMERQFEAGTVRLILDADGLAGFVAVKRRETHMLIELFNIEAGRQSRGLGSAVLRDILREADAAGLPVRLTVLKKSPAARLYERHGFRRVGENPWEHEYERKAAP